jgi:hypothetical protein
MSKPRKEHWTTVKIIFRYLRGTTSYGFFYQERPGLNRVLEIDGFVDSYCTRDIDHRIYTRRYVFNLFGGEISWMIKIQVVVAL